MARKTYGQSPSPAGSASLGPLRRKVNSRRNSDCGSCNLKLLDWANWWTDESSGTFYLHVRRFDIVGGETYHRVYCRGHYKPRLRVIAGELFWLIPRPNETSPDAPATGTQRKTLPALPASPRTTCSPLLFPSDAPKDGTVILGAFGWPWLIPASWNEHDEKWTICTLQASPMEPDGKNDSWFETDWEKPAALVGWMLIPPLPPGTRTGGFLSLPNVQEHTTPRNEA